MKKTVVKKTDLNLSPGVITQIINTELSSRKAAERFNVSQSTICKIWKANGVEKITNAEISILNKKKKRKAAEKAESIFDQEKRLIAEAKGLKFNNTKSEAEKIKAGFKWVWITGPAGIKARVLRDPKAEAKQIIEILKTF